MIRIIRQGKILVVASPTSLIPVPSKKKVIHITTVERIFPVIHEFQPDSIMLDHDHLGHRIEKVLRRLKANPFYHKIKICCYRSTSNLKTEDLLKALGVQIFIYGEDQKLQPQQKHPTVKALSEMLETRVISTLVEAGY